MVKDEIQMRSLNDKSVVTVEVSSRNAVMEMLDCSTIDAMCATLSLCF